MKKLFRHLCLLLVAALLLPILPVSAEAAGEPPVMFQDDFSGGLSNWDQSAGNIWQVQGSGAAAQLTGTTTSASPVRVTVKNAKLPYGSTDYYLEYAALGDRFRTLFRYSSSSSYYFLEFKSARMVELWKMPGSGSTVQIGSAVDISTALPGFDLAVRHTYKVEVNGNSFKLAVDGAPVAAFTDPAPLTAGGVGFSLKSVGPAVTVAVDDIKVTAIPAPDPFTIVHTAVTEIPYYTDIPVSFSLANAGSGAQTVIYYTYGNQTVAQQVYGVPVGNNLYAGVIPGTNEHTRINYYITATDGAGHSARYPATGEIHTTILPMGPYFNNFTNETVNIAPAGWTTTGGFSKVVQLADGNKVLNINGSGSAKLNLPMYQKADHFTVKFKVKYERTSEAAQNTWRFRYRATDENNNNCLEWATHNNKYFIMRKTTLGGNYYVANYVKSMAEEWHEYELRVNGITHMLFIDGVLAASGEDSDPLAPKRGYFQWNVAGGINLMIDDFAIEPIPLPYVADLQPSGNYAGIYTVNDTPGLRLALESGAQAHNFTIGYTVRKADQDKGVVATGTKSYALEGYGKITDVIPYEPLLNQPGTYEVSSQFAVDGVFIPEKAKTMRFAVIAQAAPVSVPDMDNESKFGLNTHYALNWRDAIIDGARQLGARHHRSAIAWESVDRNTKDAAGNTIYNYSQVDPLLNKLFTYGFNQIPILGIDKNPNYQNGVINTASGLKAMGSFVYHTVDRYKNQIRQWEMPNEPEIFSKPYIPAEYVQLQKIAYLNMKKADPNAMLLAGDHTSSVNSVLPAELALGSYDYADAYSYHPYVYNSMPDGYLTDRINSVKELVNAYGGWKDYYLTEGGWPTAKAGYPSVTEEIQRDYIVRAFLTYMTIDQVKAYEYYNYKNDGTDERYYDIFWGITDHDGRPKLAYAAVNQLMTTLDKAQHIGTWNTGDPSVSVEVFLNGQQPIVVAWKKVDHKDNPNVKPYTADVVLPFGPGGVTVGDINGSAVPVTGQAGGTRVTVSGSPVYMMGASSAFVLQSAVQLMDAKVQEAQTRLNATRTPGNTGVLDGVLTELAGIRGSLAAAAGSGSAAGLEQGIKEVYALMEEAAGEIGDGVIASAPGYVALEALYNLAETVSVALTYILPGSSAPVLDYAGPVQAVTASFNAKKGGYSVMPVSASADLRLNRYGRLAEAAKVRGDYAQSYAYNLLAREFAQATEAIIQSEVAKFVGVIANVAPSQVNGEAGYSNSIGISLFNDTDTVQPVTVRMQVPQGWLAAQTEPAERLLHVPAAGSLDQTYQVIVPENTPTGRYTVTYEIVYGGQVLDTKTVLLTVEDGLSVKLLPVKQTIGELNTVTVEITGTSSAAKTGKITVKGPDGAVLAPVAGDSFSGLVKGAKLRMDFTWTYHIPQPFNEYQVDIQALDTIKNKVIFHDPVMPLDFNLVQQAQGLTVDGDLIDWQDAFPVHLRTKGQNASGYSDPANLEAVAYAKWAADGLYFAVSLQDNIHKQSENGANMWKNDSVQISLDPLNNREAPYGADDVEWGFALGDDGRLMINVFNSTLPNPNGELTTVQIPFHALRDESAMRTYYEFKIPSAYVKDLLPQVGGVIGLNVAVNDADLQNGRDNFIQWTQGTADSKNTALYDSFEFIHDLPESSR